MADDQKYENEENNQKNIRKCFDGIEFTKVKDKFSILIQYDSNAESLSLKFTNQTTKNIFKHDFDKEEIQKLTSKYQMKPQLLAKMIIDTLESKERTAKYLRIFVLSDIKQATAKYNQIQQLEVVPDAVNIPSGFKPKLKDNNTENNQLENYLLFVLHFSAPPYIYLNYSFLIREEDVSEYDRLEMRFNDLQKENISLKDIVNTQQQQINQLIESVDTLSNTLQTQQQNLQQLSTKIDDETKIQEIELNLENNWANYESGYDVAKAYKIGTVVYLKGLIKSGNGNPIATLPEGWRPSLYRIFCQNQDGGAMRIDIANGGAINYHSGYKSGWIPLDGIVFVTR